nr:unnamed protein product [Haemonchus contortus]
MITLVSWMIQTIVNKPSGVSPIQSPKMPSIAIDERSSERHPTNKDESKEVIKQYEECPQRAYAGSDNGCCDNEKFLIGVAIFLMVFALLTLVNYYHMALVPLLLSIATSVVIIVGVCTKNAICMLISMILLIILAVIEIATLLYELYHFINGQNEATARAIIGFIFGILFCVTIVFAIISTCALRREY